MMLIKTLVKMRQIDSWFCHYT